MELTPVSIVKSAFWHFGWWSSHFCLWTPHLFYHESTIFPPNKIIFCWTFYHESTIFPPNFPCSLSINYTNLRFFFAGELHRIFHGSMLWEGPGMWGTKDVTVSVPWSPGTTLSNAVEVAGEAGPRDSLNGKGSSGGEAIHGLISDWWIISWLIDEYISLIRNYSWIIINQSSNSWMLIDE